MRNGSSFAWRTKPRILRAITGRTQGMMLRIKPPINASVRMPNNVRFCESPDDPPVADAVAALGSEIETVTNDADFSSPGINARPVNCLGHVIGVRLLLAIFRK